MPEAPMSIDLWCREGGSDKCYHALIEQFGAGYVVNVAYGRRGCALNTGTKTPVPVPYAEAQAIYNRLVKSKLAKGYKPIAALTEPGGPAGAVGVIVAETDRIDTGLRPQLLNPIDEAEAEAYLANPRWCVQEKFDGRRMLVRKQDGVITAANRKGLRIGLSREIEAQLADWPGNFVLDGERVGSVYHVFDLLENAQGDWRGKPYRSRLLALQRLAGDGRGSVIPAPTATDRNKRTLFAYLKQAGREGAVFKDLSAPWSAGRPARGGVQLKCKFWASCSCIVSGVNAQRSITVSLEGRSLGNVTIPPNHELPTIGQVVEVKYLYVSGLNGSLYQPVYLGVRDDIDPSSCTLAAQRLKYKAAA